MSEVPSARHGFFQSIQSVLPAHKTLHRHHHDEESTFPPGPVSALPGQLDEPPSDKTRKKGDLISSADQLALFRSLVGIDNPPGLHASTFFRSGRPAPNVGIYARVVTAEAKASHSYKVFSTFISFCIGAQVLVAACLTALGAGNASHRAITAFGALNTVLAGCMAYFKGSGLPNRLKYYQNEWTKLREYIEQRERDFCRKDCLLDLEAEVLTIERMYEDVKGDVEANTPDSFVSVRDISKRSGALHPSSSLARDTGVVIDAAADRIHDRVVHPAERSVAGLKRNLSSQSSHFGERISEKVAAYGDKYSEKVTGYVSPLQERAASYNEKVTGFEDRAHDYAGRVSSFVERPHSVGITFDAQQIEKVSPRGSSEKKGESEHDV